MPTRHDVTCILCPIGCNATVAVDRGTVVSVTNLECPRGEAYVLNEVTAPRRDFFTIIQVTGASVPVLPVRTTGPIPKERLFDCARALADVVVRAPIRLGDVVVQNLLNLGVDVISTKDLDAT